MDCLQSFQSADVIGHHRRFHPDSHLYYNMSMFSGPTFDAAVSHI